MLVYDEGRLCVSICDVSEDVLRDSYYMLVYVLLDDQILKRIVRSYLIRLLVLRVSQDPH